MCVCIHYFKIKIKERERENTLSRKTKQASQLYNHLTRRQLQSHSSTGSTAKPEFSYKPDDTVGKTYSRPCYPSPGPAKFAHVGTQVLTQLKEEKDGKRQQDEEYQELEQYHQASAEVTTNANF